MILKFCRFLAFQHLFTLYTAVIPPQSYRRHTTVIPYHRHNAVIPPPSYHRRHTAAIILPPSYHRCHTTVIPPSYCCHTAVTSPSYAETLLSQGVIHNHTAVILPSHPPHHHTAVVGCQTTFIHSHTAVGHHRGKATTGAGPPPRPPMNIVSFLSRGQGSETCFRLVFCTRLLTFVISLTPHR